MFWGNAVPGRPCQVAEETNLFFNVIIPRIPVLVHILPTLSAIHGELWICFTL